MTEQSTTKLNVILSAHETAIDLANRSDEAKLNEANTRHQIIDVVLHNILSWPRELTACETHISPGYADYFLTRTDKTPILLVEAKKEGHYFTLPGGISDPSQARSVQVKTLLTDVAIRTALMQVHEYCVNTGCQFAGITNGHQWIFFRVFQPGQDWRNLHAYVVPSLKYFADSFTEATNNFGYKALSEQGALGRLLGAHPVENRQVFYPKRNVIAYQAPIHANFYSPTLTPIVKRFFANLDESDERLMSHCYVTDTKYDTAFKTARLRLKDSLTPYLAGYQIKQIQDTDDGGAFAGRIQKSVRERRGADVVVLFGGKGVGKSTFLRRLLFYRAPQYLKKHSIPSIVNLLEKAEIKEDLYKYIWDKVVEDLDVDGVLKNARPALLQLFHDRFEQAKKQSLFGLSEDSEVYNVELNRLTQVWLNDKKYCARVLAAYWARKHRGVIVVIDNTDQLRTDIQEFCFTTAHEISKELGCLAIISMREERFHASAIRGTLDAFHNSGFHISSPSPYEVFSKRIGFVITVLRTRALRESLFGEQTHEKRVIERVQRLFETLANEYESSQSHLADFLSACAHGNIRKALDLFGGFLLSRYTNVTEMTSVEGYWNILIHQVLKPIMIPYRFFYSEVESLIPNLYQVRSARNGSHLTALRILSQLSHGDPTNPPFVPLARLATDFIEAFNMKEDFELNLDMLLKHGLIEADNRVDEYRPDLDGLRITNYGRYMYNEMCRFFTYIDLVSIDCAIFDEGVANSLVVLCNSEYQLWEGSVGDRANRIKRVETRLEKAGKFLEYLAAEERREHQLYSLGDRGLLVPPMLEAFGAERVTVRRSASRQRY